MAVGKFEDLDVWKEARRLSNELYAATRDAGFSKDFGLRGADPTRERIDHVQHCRGI
jgi:hypothetical protein